MKYVIAGCIIGIIAGTIIGFGICGKAVGGYPVPNFCNYTQFVFLMLGGFVGGLYGIYKKT